MGKAENLAERLRSTLEAVDQAKRERDRAIIGNKPFDLTALARLEAEAEAIEAAQAELVRLGRAEAQAEHEGNLAALRGKLRRTEEKRLEAIADAEAAAQQFVDAVHAALDANATIRGLYQQITGRGNHNLLPIELVENLASLFALKAHTISRRCETGFHLGRRMTLPEHPHWNARTDWTDVEAKFGAMALARAFEEK